MIKFNPPTEAALYLLISEWNAEERAQYFSGAGDKVASSRETPARIALPPEGTWRIDDQMRGLHGREIEVLCFLDPAELLLKEDLVEKNIEARGDDAKRYAEWMKEGLVPPPIRAVQLADGTGRISVSDGHRRVAAAKLAKCKVPAWVSPVMPHPQGWTDTTPNNYGNVQLVGMTYEGMTGREYVAPQGVARKGGKLGAEWVYHNARRADLPQIMADGLNAGSFAAKPIDFGRDIWIAARIEDLPPCATHPYGDVLAYEPTWEVQPHEPGYVAGEVTCRSVPIDKLIAVDRRGRVIGPLHKIAEDVTQRLAPAARQPITR